MKEERVEKIYKLEEIGNGKIIPNRINGQHPEDRVLKPF